VGDEHYQRPVDVGADEDGLCSLPRLRGVEILAGERQGAEAILATLAEESLDYADSPHRERASAAGHVQTPRPVGLLTSYLCRLLVTSF
jgi:hypothetical protein